MKKQIAVIMIVAASACAVYAQQPAAQQPAGEQKAAAAVTVVKMVTAAGVEKREAVGETAAFDASVTQVYTWAKLTAETTPVTVKHVYYLDGKKVREIPLQVTASPYRLWSVKNVTPGSWKVEFTDEAGKVLAEAAFTVGQAAQEPVKEPAKAPAK